MYVFPWTCFLLQEVYKEFSTTMAALIEVIEGTSFKWTPKA